MRLAAVKAKKRHFKKNNLITTSSNSKVQDLRDVLPPLLNSYHKPIYIYLVPLNQFIFKKHNQLNDSNIIEFKTEFYCNRYGPLDKNLGPNCYIICKKIKYDGSNHDVISKVQAEIFICDKLNAFSKINLTPCAWITQYNYSKLTCFGIQITTYNAIEVDPNFTFVPRQLKEILSNEELSELNASLNCFALATPYVSLNEKDFQNNINNQVSSKVKGVCYVGGGGYDNRIGNFILSGDEIEHSFKKFFFYSGNNPYYTLWRLVTDINDAKWLDNLYERYSQDNSDIRSCIDDIGL